MLRFLLTLLAFTGTVTAFAVIMMQSIIGSLGLNLFTIF